MASLGLPGLAGFWGEFPAILSAYNPAPGLKVETVPHLHGDRRRRHRARRRLPAVAVPARRRSASRRAEFAPTHHIHDVEVPEWIAWTPLLVGILVLGIYPNILFKIIEPGRDHGRLAGATDDDVIAAVLARRPGSRRRSTTTRSRPRSSSPARSSCCCSPTSSCRSGRSGRTSTIAGLGLLAALVPILTLAIDGDDRSMFNGGYVVDNFALVLKALFLLAGYVVILLSTTYVEEGDYYQGEYYFLLLSSVLGMVMMASARDLVSIFIALELLSIPAYMLAAWRKRDEKSNEAGDEVLPARRVRLGRDALRHVAVLRRRRHDPADRHRRDAVAKSGNVADHLARRSCSSSSASPSRSRPCRSTRGRPTRTRARRRPSPRSCRWRRRRPASSRS